MPVGAGGLPGRPCPSTSFSMRYSLHLRRVAARQHGLVTLEQAVADGWSRATWYRAGNGGGLVLLAPAVAALPGAPDTPEQRILAAVLAGGGRAIASHRSAAYLWGVDIDGANPVDLTGVGRGCRPALAWVAAHNPRDVDDLRPVQRRGIPTTNPLRVLVDLGQVAPTAVTAALQHYLAEGLVDLRSVKATLVRHARKGRHGISALRGALDAATIDGAPADSELEPAMAALLAAHGLPPAQFHARILGFEVDFAIVPERVVLECDGWTSHGLDRVQFERDRRRDAALAAAGWIVLRFTWAQITRRPAWVAEAIRQTLLQQRAGLLKPIWRGIVASVRRSRARTPQAAPGRAGRRRGRAASEAEPVLVQRVEVADLGLLVDGQRDARLLASQGVQALLDLRQVERSPG